jgi:hypothetical protein
MRMERQQRTFSDDPYATRSTAGAVDASVRPCVPARHPLLVARRATHAGGPSRTRPWPPRSCWRRL